MSEGREESYRRAGRRPKKVTKTMNEMASTTRAIVAMAPMVMMEVNVIDGGSGERAADACRVRLGL